MSLYPRPSCPTGLAAGVHFTGVHLFLPIVKDAQNMGTCPHAWERTCSCWNSLLPHATLCCDNGETFGPFILATALSWLHSLLQSIAASPIKQPSTLKQNVLQKETNLLVVHKSCPAYARLNNSCQEECDAVMRLRGMKLEPTIEKLDWLEKASNQQELLP